MWSGRNLHWSGSYLKILISATQCLGLDWFIYQQIFNVDTELWMPYCWNCSKPGWMRPWATWSRGWYPCLWLAELHHLLGPFLFKPFCVCGCAQVCVGAAQQHTGTSFINLVNVQQLWGIGRVCKMWSVTPPVIFYCEATYKVTFWKLDAQVDP